MQADCTIYPKKKICRPSTAALLRPCWNMACGKAGRRNKVTARFVDIADLAREAHYAARGRGRNSWCARRMFAARWPAKMERHNLIETRIREMIEEGTLLVDVCGTCVGQVNGLSVLEIGGYSFGKPVRITATAATGQSAA